MQTEKSPLASRSVPRYTFLGSEIPPRQKFGRFHCCVCAVLITFLLMTLIITLSFYLSWSHLNGMTLNSTQSVDDLLQLQWPLKEEKYTDLLGDLNNEMRAFEVGTEDLKKKDSVEEILPFVATDSPSFRHYLATSTSDRAQEMSRLGFVLNAAAKEINKWFENTTDWNKRKPRRWVFTQPSKCHPEDPKVPSLNVTIKCSVTPYRTADGTCNNLLNPTWGAALHTFRRILLPKYEDGVAEPRRASDGSALPSAREVSLTIHRPVYENDASFTIMLAVWGQFIDHDITATAISRGKKGTPIKCCQTKSVHPECFPIVLGLSDSFYFQKKVTCMEFVRSAPAPTYVFGPREQLNQATSFLDGSVVYGNDVEEMNHLRTFTGGELKMLKTSAGDLLPISDDPNDGCNRKEEFERGRYCFLSGDKRANENLLLTSMHLLFARQHNSVARKLAKINSHWTDEKLFQETRKIIGAQIQHITYNEFLPSVLPEKLMTRLNISTKLQGYSQLYNSSVNPTIANVFASAAFRFGHSLLPSLMQFLHNNSTRKEYLELHKMLFNPFKLYEEEFLEDIMKGAMNTSSAKYDVHFSQELTQNLFQKEPENPYGLDLVALNIQRGRDHGLPSYPNWRTICGLKRPERFDELKDDIDEETLSKLEKLFKSVDDLDFYSGALAEKPLMGGLVGPTITCLLVDQFLRLKVGDRYWYETMEEPQRYMPEQLNEIRKTSLAKVICETSGVSESQPYVMRRAGANNFLRPCDKFTFPDFEPWKEA